MKGVTGMELESTPPTPLENVERPWSYTICWESNPLPGPNRFQHVPLRTLPRRSGQNIYCVCSKLRDTRREELSITIIRPGFIVVMVVVFDLYYGVYNICASRT